MSAEVDRRFHEALALHQQGRLPEAERLYGEIVARVPEHFDALHLLGVVAAQTGRIGRSIELIRRAVAINPRHAEAHGNLGNALKAAGDNNGALASYASAVALKPDYLEAHYNRGTLLNELDRYDEALASFDVAIALQPNFANAHFGRGVALMALKNSAGAAASFDRTIALRPDLPAAHALRGDALSDLGRYEAAVASYDAALGGAPEAAGIHTNRGVALNALKRHEEALAAYDRALSLQPGDPVAHNNRGGALSDLRRYPEAVAAFERAIGLNPRYAAGYGNLGIALSAAGRRTEAITSYDRAVALDPGNADAHYNRGNTLMQQRRYAEASTAFERALAARPDCDYALGCKLDAQLRVCDWSGFDALARQVTEGVRAGKRVITPFPFLLISESPVDQSGCAALYAAQKYPAAPAALWTGVRYGHDKIRLAYLSADYHDHPVAYLAAELFELHDRGRFEVRAYSFGPDDPTDMRPRLLRAFDSFTDVRGRSDAQVARMLRDAETDIAIDLKGYTDDCRPGILAHRPAPVQINYLGYPGTMGSRYVDYIVADATVIPPAHEPAYAEKIIRLPHAYQVNDRKRPIGPRAPTRREAGLPESGFVFCCFNQSCKILPAMFDVWMRLLIRVDGSVLWLFHDNAEVCANLRREASARGVTPERLVFAARLPQAEHLARHGCADLFLDTLPYNAHTTASDALWAGLPVLTCLGESFAGRVAASLLTAAGLPTLATASLGEYEALALRLATSPKLLAEIKATLAVNRTTQPLFNTPAFTRHIERAFEVVHERQRRGLFPASFAVLPNF